MSQKKITQPLNGRIPRGKTVYSWFSSILFFLNDHQSWLAPKSWKCKMISESPNLINKLIKIVLNLFYKILSMANILWQFGFIFRKHYLKLLSSVYTGEKTIYTCRWRLRFETDFSILKLHCWAKSPTQIACVNKPLRSIYTWEGFHIMLAQLPTYKNSYVLWKGLAYCEIMLWNWTC